MPLAAHIGRRVRPAAPQWSEAPAIPAGSARSLSLHAALFRLLYSHNLLYNISWEDPAIDRQALRPGPGDRLLVITSAGCNVLDYALEAPEEIVAVDTNPRQTALLELKLAAIRRLSYDDVFALFGRGWHPAFAELYLDALRDELSAFARSYWDTHGHWFARESGGLYAHGLCGIFARAIRWHLRVVPGLEQAARALFEQPDLQSQRIHYATEFAPRFWSPIVRAALSTHLVTSMLGVPLPQRRAVGVRAGSIPESARRFIDELFCTVPANDNYFWALYVFGEFRPDCCPRYLTPDGFARLKAGLADRIRAHTCSVTRYLQLPGPQFTGALLLDHMDWMANDSTALAAEWEALYERMEAGGKILFRSAHAFPPYLRGVHVGPSKLPLAEWLLFRPEEARRLAQMDRVHTYASFHIAEVPN